MKLEVSWSRKLFQRSSEFPFTPNRGHLGYNPNIFRHIPKWRSSLKFLDFYPKDRQDGVDISLYPNKFHAMTCQMSYRALNSVVLKSAKFILTKFDTLYSLRQRFSLGARFRHQPAQNFRGPRTDVYDWPSNHCQNDRPVQPLWRDRFSTWHWATSSFVRRYW